MSTSSIGDQSKILLSGAIAGAVSRTTTAPLERIKIFKQVTSISTSARAYSGVWGALKQMAEREGLRGLFKGNGTNCVKVVPASAIRFLAFENLKSALLVDGSQRLSTGAKLIAGSGAGVTAVACTYPLDLIRTRLALQVDVKHYNGIGDAFRKIVASQGARGLFRGVGTAMTSVMPFSALNFTSYELLKEFFGPRIQSKSVLLNAAYGACAGSIAMTILYPLDLLKRQLMIQGHGDTAQRYNNGYHAFRSILRTEGPRGLYHGIIPSYMKVIPTVSITWMSYELMKKYFGITRGKK